MSIVKLNDRAVKDATTFGSISSLGEMVFISKATASASASIEFTSGIDSTYKEYVFYFVNMHPAVNGSNFKFNFSTDSGSNYNVVKTSTAFRPFHYESDGTDFGYNTSNDLAQSSSDQTLGENLGNANDEGLSGYLHIFNPSSTTYVKHWISSINLSHNATYPASVNWFTAGYGNTTSSINAVKFLMDLGNTDSGEILLFGIN